MKIYKSLSKIEKVNYKTALTLGVFDGVHRGHRKILKELINLSKKENLVSLVVTFWPHPLKIFKSKNAPPLINTLKQRLDLIESLGVDVSLVLRFSRKTALMSAYKFVTDILLKKLNMSYLVVSSDYRFGKDAKGNIELLRKLSKRYDFKLKELAIVERNKKQITSTLIRNLLRQGRISEANEMLARCYFLEGIIIKGKGLGSKIGYPTVNLKTDQDIILKSGVYISYLEYQHHKLKSVVNIGYNPTIKPRQKKKSVEAHILNFNQELYNQKVKIYFLKKIRDEKRFKTLEELTRAIKEDIDKTQGYFRKTNIG